MNRSLLLHVVERLEGLVGKLPATIQKPILNELTPLKELFLQQRPPRFLFTGSNKATLRQIVAELFPGFSVNRRSDNSKQSRSWQEFTLMDRGTISVIDARENRRGSDEAIEQELRHQAADIVFFFDEDERRKIRKALIDDLEKALSWNDRTRSPAALIGIILAPSAESGKKGDAKSDTAERESRLQTALATASGKTDRVVRVFTVRALPEFERDARAMMSVIARNLPNEARIEITRISGDKDAQAEIAQLLVKSTTAICTAIGAQPIPLADLPILTTLQLMMVSGIMYLSGRERSLRAATEFVAALGANVGAGMLLREGTRAILKFFPGWGNLVCGMVAGAGTYGIGRAAIAYFLEGVSLKDARRTYLASRKKSPRPALLGRGQAKKEFPESAPVRRRRLRLRR